jgi:2-dehydro-3-deoxyphosphogluconate aldolase/(4S)-4-hydroxy-2-oxoglutarate aldolase
LITEFSRPISLWHLALRQHRAIAVIRTQDFDLGLRLASLAAGGGMGLIEITWNSTQPARLISRLRQQLPHCWIGTGTLLRPQDLQEAIAAGSQFCFTPHVDAPLIKLAQEHQIPLIAGALTPTEIITAWQAGATTVKVFPIEAVGGVAYIKALQGPLNTIPLIPTGGVTLTNAVDFLRAGAVAVGLAGQLFPSSLISQQDWWAIEERIRTFNHNLAPWQETRG